MPIKSFFLTRQYIISDSTIHRQRINSRVSTAKTEDSVGKFMVATDWKDALNALMI